MKSRSVTPDPSSTVGEKSKEFADKALNLINPRRCVFLQTLENETTLIVGSMNRGGGTYSKPWRGGKMRTRILTGCSLTSGEEKYSLMRGNLSLEREDPLWTAALGKFHDIKSLNN